MFGIYVHIPYCTHRCSYCDFYSVTDGDKEAFEKLLCTLIKEIGSVAHWFTQQKKALPPAISLFLGGGTPSLIAPNLLVNLVRSIRSHFPLAEKVEITSEANPESLTRDWLESAQKVGINRISLGAQSFHPKYLQLLERRTTAQQVQFAVSLIRDAGFSNYNLDLIFGIPGQSLSEMCEDIDRAMALEPTHISFYNLTLKKGHNLFDALPSDEECADLYEAGVERLEKGGFKQYEISNFSSSGLESRHNLLYWSGGDFLGLGPSAASRFFWDGKFHHHKQSSNLEAYFRDPVFARDGFESNETGLEALFLEIRKNAGIDLVQFRSRYGITLNSTRIERYAKEGLLETSGSILRLTKKGRLLVDSIALELSEGIQI